MAFSQVYYVISRHSNIYKQTRLAQQTVAESGKISNREPTYNFMGAVLQVPNSEVYSFTSHLTARSLFRGVDKQYPGHERGNAAGISGTYPEARGSFSITTFSLDLLGISFETDVWVLVQPCERETYSSDSSGSLHHVLETPRERR